MKTTDQTFQQVERTISKIIDKFPTNVEPTILTDIHLRANQETGELVAFDDDDKEITRTVIEQWINNQDDNFYEKITGVIRKCIDRKKKQIEKLSILKPYSFVLEDEEKDTPVNPKFSSKYQSHLFSLDNNIFSSLLILKSVSGSSFLKHTFPSFMALIASVKFIVFILLSLIFSI